MFDNASLKNIVILGSTGSIGKSALEIVRTHKDKFNLYGICAGSNKEKLIQQVEEFNPSYAVLVNDPEKVWVKQQNAKSTRLLSGVRAIEEIVSDPAVDLVLIAIVGVAALRPAYAAIKAGKKVLLANKEALVCAGSLLMNLAKESKAKIIPVDSEHSAIYQLLQGDTVIRSQINNITITASGGPFFKTPLEELKEITFEQAINHPRWSMGPKISIDSATMVNKALEIAEAFWLFFLPVEKINTVIHPESIIHGLVEFIDGTTFAHMSNPDMKSAIAFAMTEGKYRLKDVISPLDFSKLRQLTFSPIDSRRFKAPSIMVECLKAGGLAPAIFNCANEIAVQKFIQKKIKFVDIVSVIEKALTRFAGMQYSTIDDILTVNDEIEKYLWT